MSEHVGYDKHDPVGRNGGNSRNGTRTKSVLTAAVSSTCACWLRRFEGPPRRGECHLAGGCAASPRRNFSWRVLRRDINRDAKLRQPGVPEAAGEDHKQTVDA